jgi:hypothetical protein
VAVVGATPDQAAEHAIRLLCHRIARPAFYSPSRRRLAPSTKERILGWTLWWVTPPTGANVRGLPGCSIQRASGVSIGSFIVIGDEDKLALVGYLDLDGSRCSLTEALASPATVHHDCRRFLRELILSNEELLHTSTQWTQRSR